MLLSLIQLGLQAQYPCLVSMPEANVIFLPDHDIEYSLWLSGYLMGNCFMINSLSYSSINLMSNRAYMIRIDLGFCKSRHFQNMHVTSFFKRPPHRVNQAYQLPPTNLGSCTRVVPSVCHCMRCMVQDHVFVMVLYKCIQQWNSIILEGANKPDLTCVVTSSQRI